MLVHPAREQVIPSAPCSQRIACPRPLLLQSFMGNDDGSSAAGGGAGLGDSELVLREMQGLKRMMENMMRQVKILEANQQHLLSVTNMAAGNLVPASRTASKADALPALAGRNLLLSPLGGGSSQLVRAGAPDGNASPGGANQGAGEGGGQRAIHTAFSQSTLQSYDMRSSDAGAGEARSASFLKPKGVTLVAGAAVAASLPEGQAAEQHKGVLKHATSAKVSSPGSSGNLQHVQGSKVSFTSKAQLAQGGRDSAEERDATAGAASAAAPASTAPAKQEPERRKVEEEEVEDADRPAAHDLPPANVLPGAVPDDS